MISKKFTFTSFYVLIIYIFCEVVFGTWSLQEQAKLIKSLAQHLNCKSIVLLSNNLDSPNKTIYLEKQIVSDAQFFTTVWSFKDLIHYLHSDKVFTLKTLVVIESDTANIKSLDSVSQKASLASTDWLILPSLSSNKIQDNFKDLKIPINCLFIVSTVRKKGFVTLYEIYRTSRHSELIQTAFAWWSLNEGLHSVKGDIFDRRMNLMGHQFKFAVHSLSYGVNPCKGIQIDNGKQMIQCAYFDVWRNLGQVLNYTTKYVVIEDCYKNGTTGISTPMLEMIRTGGADSGEDGYIWSSARLIYNQFFWPLFHSKVILVTKIPSRKFSISSYVRPFDASLWLVLASWFLLSGTIIMLTKHLVAKYFNMKAFLLSNDTTENLFLPLSAICYQGSPSIPQKAAIRIVYLMIYIIPVLLIPSYSGSIISSLSVPSENIPFVDLDGFEKDGTYQLNAINNTFFQFFLMTDEKFDTLRQKKLVSAAMTVTYEQSFRDICSKRVTFMYEWPLLTKNTIMCNVFKFDLSLKKIFSSMAVRKNFPYLELFNRQMQKLINAGLNVKILEKSTLELFKHEVNPFPPKYFQVKPFGIEDVSPLFAVLAVGMFLSLFVLLFENYISKYKTNFLEDSQLVNTKKIKQ